MAIRPSRKTNEKFPTRVGAVRPSQLLHTYGVGALVDLPNFSVIVAGLQAWDRPSEEIIEPRILAAVQAELGPQVERLVAMPWKENTNNPFDDWTHVGIPVLPFPRWFRCTRCNVLSTIDGGLFSLDSHPYRLDRVRYVHTNCSQSGNSALAVPARFVVACTNGHLDEFPWEQFAHHYKPCPKGGGTLKLFEPGSGTRSTDVFVQCTACEQSNTIGTAFDPRAKEGAKCRGRHPHLRTFDDSCEEIAQPLLLGASNTWFGIVRSALAIPVEAATAIDQEVESAWTDLANPKIRDESTLEMALEFNPKLHRLRAFALGDLWAAIERLRLAEITGPAAQSPDLRFPEWARFVDPMHAPKSNDFTIEDAGVPTRFVGDIAQLIAVSRLRETTALVGFARIDPPDSGVDQDVETARRVPLTTGAPFWVPASDTRGEGIFLALSEERVRAWEDRVGDHERIEALRTAIISRHGSDAWLGTRYVLLHSLAHLLVNELALECGYNAASLRERIYSQGSETGDPMAGILIYTAAADSEGTLGGLVAMANEKTFGRVVEAALRRSELCSSDPLCAEHFPTPDDRTLHGAACHSCLFLPETSCERNNRLLDRATLVETMTGSGIEYFERR